MANRLLTDAGLLDWSCRGTNSTFTPQTAANGRKGQRRVDGIDNLVMASTPWHDGPRHPVPTAGDLRSGCLPDLISKITDGVLEEARDRQFRPLDRVYPVIFLDAIVCKVRPTEA